VSWWLSPSRWHVLLAQTGPSSWPRAASATATTKVRVPGVVVSNQRVGVSTVSFHVSRIGVPVLVHVSYYPRWHVTGATGPYRVSPNLMVVVPTARAVTLSYGSSPANNAGVLLSAVGVLAALSMAMVGLVRRRRRAPVPAP
jgi:hypothetical protein